MRRNNRRALGLVKDGIVVVWVAKGRRVGVVIVVIMEGERLVVVVVVLSGRMDSVVGAWWSWVRHHHWEGQSEGECWPSFLGE